MRYKQQIVLIASFAIFPVVIFAQNYNDFKSDSLIKVFEGVTFTEDDSLLFSIATDIYRTASDINIRLKYANLSFKLADKMDNDKFRGEAKLRIGITYKKLGDLEQAYNNILKCLEYYEDIDYSIGILEAYSKLSIILIAQNEYDGALKYMLKILSEFEHRKDFIRYASTSTNIGELYRLNKNYIQAKKFSLDALKIYKEKNYQTGVGYALGNIGLIYLAQDSLQKAITNLNRSISILEPLGDNYSTSVYYEGLAQVYQKQKKCSSALSKAQKSLQLAQIDGLIEQIRDANLRLSEIYSNAEQYKQAHKYYKQYIVYRDSLVNEKNIKEIANMRRQYEVAQKQTEVDELNQQREYLFSLQVFQAIAVGLLIITILVLAKYYRRKKKDNKKLELQQAELQRLNATKDKFFSIIAHDLRSPVSSFYGFLDVIDNLLKLGSIENLQRLFKDLKQSTKYILELMDNLLNWGLSQKGELPYLPVNCNIKEAVEKVCGLLCKSAELKKINLSYSLDENLHVFADERMFHSILRNLTSNALKFTPEGGAVSITAKPANGNVLIIIEDTGVGMAKEKVERLFDLDRSESTYGTNNEKGMGLGLRLVSEFIEKNKGKIEAESEVGKGTRMIVRLPINNTNH